MVAESPATSGPLDFPLQIASIRLDVALALGLTWSAFSWGGEVSKQPTGHPPELSCTAKAADYDSASYGKLTGSVLGEFSSVAA